MKRAFIPFLVVLALSVSFCVGSAVQDSPRVIGIAVATLVFSIMVVLSTEYTGYHAAKKLHSDMADHIIFAPMK